MDEPGWLLWGPKMLSELPAPLAKIAGLYI